MADTVTSSLVRMLPGQYCENSTSREGCFRDEKRDKSRWCSPCLAREELQMREAPRRCENCQAIVSLEGVDDRGRRTCPPPKHRPHRFYEEFKKIGSE
jgi:hypothetical protein